MAYLIVFLLGVFVGALANAKFRNKIFTSLKNLAKKEAK